MSLTLQIGTEGPALAYAVALFLFFWPIWSVMR